METFGEWLRTQLGRADLTERGFAREIGVSAEGGGNGQLPPARVPLFALFGTAKWGTSWGGARRLCYTVCMDHVSSDLGFERFFAVRRDAWVGLMGALRAAGADDELLLDVDLLGSRAAAVLRVDLRVALRRAAARSRANARLLDAAKPAILGAAAADGDF